ncbi:MAG: serine/threonine protein phosphatase [Armatimonadetes bacterium]|jgi:predicted phosphohydrolase|nr:serine/threonine protein phosphatase [Armatimonadota bacterium]
MAIYAISDMHLSLSGDKPMDMFGEVWRDHASRIATNWDSTVKDGDTVLLAGDHSWELKFDQARLDLDFIAARPGRKILIRGNHDYWWGREATTRIQKKLPEDMTLLHGRALVVEGIGIAGTRGWRVESQEEPTAGDDKVMMRELAYLQRGLSEIPSDVSRKIAMLHYPPFDANLEPNTFTDILQAHNVDILVYGHIHTGGFLQGNIGGIEYKLVCADYLNMQPVRVI